jgi:hypothetical protein
VLEREDSERGDARGVNTGRDGAKDAAHG